MNSMNREINDTNQNGTRISGCRLLKRVLSILLCISLLFSSSIVTLAAGSAYTLNEAMSGTSIGTISYEGNSYPVYLFQFDAKQYSSLIISCTATSTYNNVYTTYDVDPQYINVSIGSESKPYSEAKDFFQDVVTDASIVNSLDSKNDHLLFLLYKDGRRGGPKGYLIVEWPNNDISDANITTLQETVKKVTGENAERYYHTYDRWNGRHWSKGICSIIRTAC